MVELLVAHYDALNAYLADRVLHALQVCPILDGLGRCRSGSRLLAASGVPEEQGHLLGRGQAGSQGAQSGLRVPGLQQADRFEQAELGGLGSGLPILPQRCQQLARAARVGGGGGEPVLDGGVTLWIVPQVGQVFGHRAVIAARRQLQ